MTHYAMLHKYGKRTRDLIQPIFLYFGGVFSKTIIPFALVRYEIGYSQLGPAGLDGYFPSHIQRALISVFHALLKLT